MIRIALLTLVGCSAPTAVPTVPVSIAMVELSADIVDVQVRLALIGEGVCLHVYDVDRLELLTLVQLNGSSSIAGVEIPEQPDGWTMVIDDCEAGEDLVPASVNLVVVYRDELLG